MHRDTASRILRDRGREAWEVSVLVAFLSESGVLSAIAEGSDFDDINEAARLFLELGPVSGTLLRELLAKSRDARSRKLNDQVESLIESLTLAEESYPRPEIEARVRHLATVEAQIARFGVPAELVVPVAGLLQAADCDVSENAVPDQVRMTIHEAVRRLLDEERP